jgi:hypothetical protein
MSVTPKPLTDEELAELAHEHDEPRTADIDIAELIGRLRGSIGIARRFDTSPMTLDADSLEALLDRLEVAERERDELFVRLAAKGSMDCKFEALADAILGAQKAMYRHAVAERDELQLKHENAVAQVLQTLERNEELACKLAVAREALRRIVDELPVGKELDAIVRQAIAQLDGDKGEDGAGQDNVVYTDRMGPYGR